jgi:hypothetical protein
MSIANESEHSSPKSRPWQFGLRRIFVATTAVAVVMGLAASSGLNDAGAMLCLVAGTFVSVFSTSARKAILGVCAIVGALWGACALDGRIGHLFIAGPIAPSGSVWIFVAVLVALAASIRLVLRASAWSMVASLVLAELSIAVVLISAFSNRSLFQTIASEDFLSSFLDGLRNQQWYIAAPWLLGVVIGEIIVRRRRASDARQEEV